VVSGMQLAAAWDGANVPWIGGCECEGARAREGCVNGRPDTRRAQSRRGSGRWAVSRGATRSQAGFVSRGRGVSAARLLGHTECRGTDSCASSVEQAVTVV
jgi:hypothetical protein